MVQEPRQDLSQFRITLFVGPQPVDGKPFTQSTVFNVKKRSWKGGIQVAVELDHAQIDRLLALSGFSEWMNGALSAIPLEELPSYQHRAQELFVQAVSRCKLELLLQAGLNQENQCLLSDTFVGELERAIVSRQSYVMSFVSMELDLLPDDSSPASR